MERVFELRTEPHKATIGNVTLLLQAEIEGARFAGAYTALQAAQRKFKPTGNKATSTKHAKEADLNAEDLAGLSSAMRDFVGTFVMDETREAYDSLRLPDRVLVELVEWVGELYGSGSGNGEAAAADDGGQSSDS